MLSEAQYEELKALVQDTAFVHVTNQWRMIEIELARLEQDSPKAFQRIVEAWADDGWLVEPPWGPEGSDGVPSEGEAARDIDEPGD